MDDDQQFCLRWNNHQSTLISVFDTLLENGTLVDCTLAAEGKFLKAHKVVLSACSPYFAALLSQQYDKHPIFILKDVKFQELRAMMDYMYRGEVNISQDQLAALLKAAESLQIKGLSDSRGSTSSQKSEATTSKTLQPQVPVNKASGLTIENKRPLKALGTDILDTDVSGSREGSTSPTSRKRKKIRRKSLESNNLLDNHDQHSNSSSQSMHTNTVTSLANQSSTSTVANTNNNATSLSVPSNNVANIKKTENIHQHQQQSDALKHQIKQQQQQQPDDDDDDDGNDEDDENINDSDMENETESQSKHKDMKSMNQSELMIEPKNEYDDGNDENVEDLTLDDEELLEDMEQPGPSHGGEGSSQGYAQWQMDRAPDEAFMSQEGGGQHRDAQGTKGKTPQLKKSKPAQDLNDLNDCLLESKNIVVSKKDNNYVLFTTGSESGELDVASDVDNEKDDKTQKKADDTQDNESTSFIFDECDILPLKGKGKDNSNSVTAKKQDKTTMGNVVAKAGSTMSSVQAILSDSVGSNANSVVNSNQSQIINKKIVKLTHPRIKYSKHKNPQILQSTTLPSSMVIPLPNQQQAIIQTPETSNTPAKIELLNFSLSRKSGTMQPLQLPAVIPRLTQGRYSTTEYETSTSNTSQSNDFPSAIMDDLDYSVIDDIELPDDVQVNFGDSFTKPSQNIHQNQSQERNSDHKDESRIELKTAKIEPNVLSTIEDKYALLANTSIMKNFEYTVNETTVSDNEENDARQYICRHCNKRYRWKSTLRRHENVECGGKEASHQCPYCNYRAKQRGNLGVHIRKHHAEMPQLESRRRSQKSRDSM